MVLGEIYSLVSISIPKASKRKFEVDILTNITLSLLFRMMARVIGVATQIKCVAVHQLAWELHFYILLTLLVHSKLWP